MQLTLHQLLPLLLHEFRQESDLLKAIAEISRKFTVEREALSDYLVDPRLVSAYCAFYLTTNFPKFEAILPWMPGEWLEEIKNCDLVDLGAGPGTFSLAWKAWAGKSAGRVYQIETSEVMREQARKIWEGFYPGTELIQSRGPLEESGRPKILLFGHSANEMGLEKVIQYMEATKPQHVLFIEPGTSSFFPEMLKIRDYLVEKEHKIIFPCPTSAECPMSGTQNWCHQYIHVRHSADVERLTQLAEKDRRTLPLIVHAYSLKDKYQDVQERLVRTFPETKFSYEWEVCHNNVLEHYQVMKRGLSKSEERVLSRYEAGEPLKTELEKEFEKTKRVKLLKLI